MLKELWNVPNVVSLIRLALVPVFIWLVATDEYGWAGILLAVIGGTDWIDGYLARRLDQVTEVGKFLDPLADRIAVIIAVIAGLVTAVLPAWFAWLLIAREVLIGIGAIIGWMNGVQKLDVRWLGKLATLLLYIAVSLFYVGVGFDLDWITWIAYLLGIPGLVIYWFVAFQYLGDMRAAIAQAE
jgi:cardiolipin synthase